MIITECLEYSWQRVVADLFQLKTATYLAVVDYFSRYVEVAKLGTTTSSQVIQTLKCIFSRHGIPEVFVSDNGPQFSSQEMRKFAEEYGLQHVTSSPHCPQSNGQIERTIQTVKKLLSAGDDPNLSLNYRATPLPWCGVSPEELLMGRRLRTTVPQIREWFMPGWPYLKELKTKNRAYKEKQKENYDRSHRVKPRADMEDGTPV